MTDTLHGKSVDSTRHENQPLPEAEQERIQKAFELIRGIDKALADSVMASEREEIIKLREEKLASIDPESLPPFQKKLYEELSLINRPEIPDNRGFNVSVSPGRS